MPAQPVHLGFQRRTLTQYQLADQLPKTAVAMTADIGFGQLLIDQALFGFLTDCKIGVRPLASL